MYHKVQRGYNSVSDDQVKKDVLRCFPLCSAEKSELKTKTEAGS
jgi:hypothetical protein